MTTMTVVQGASHFCSVPMQCYSLPRFFWLPVESQVFFMCMQGILPSSHPLLPGYFAVFVYSLLFGNAYKAHKLPSLYFSYEPGVKKVPFLEFHSTMSPKRFLLCFVACVIFLRLSKASKICQRNNLTSRCMLLPCIKNSS